MIDNLFPWLALIGFLTWILPWWIATDGTGYFQDQDMRSALIETKLEHIFRSLFILIGISCAILMLYQGFHLLSEGWDPWVQSNVDASVIGKNAARSRGRGGIIILLINFFPQFLIASSIYTLFTGRKFIKDNLIIVSRFSWYIKSFLKGEAIRVNWDPNKRSLDSDIQRYKRIYDEIPEIPAESEPLSDDQCYITRKALTPQILSKLDAEEPLTVAEGTLYYFNLLCSNGRSPAEAFEVMRNSKGENGERIHYLLFNEKGKINPITPEERANFPTRFILKKLAALYNPNLFM